MHNWICCVFNVSLYTCIVYIYIYIHPHNEYLIAFIQPTQCTVTHLCTIDHFPSWQVHSWENSWWNKKTYWPTRNLMKSNEIHIPSTQTNENCLGLAANKVLNGRMAEWLTKQVLVVDSYFHYDLMPILNGNQTFLEVFFLFGSCKSLQAVRSPMKLQDILNMTMGGPASSNDFLH